MEDRGAVSVILGHSRIVARGFALFALTAFLALARESPASACTCMWAGGFLKVAPGAEVIVRVRVRDYHGQARKVHLAMDAVVLERLKGSPKADDIRIWGDNGILCRPYVSAFPRGTEWILAIRPLSGPYGDEAGRAGDYYIPGCGAYWLRVNRDRVTGHIRDGAPGRAEQELSLDALRAALTRH